MGTSVAPCLECFQKNQGSDRDDQGSSPTPKSNPKVIKPPPGSHHKAELLMKASGSRKCLLKEKIKVIHLSSRGISTRKLESGFGCGKTDYEGSEKPRKKSCPVGTLTRNLHPRRDQITMHHCAPLSQDSIQKWSIEKLQIILAPSGRKIAPNTGANATKFFTLVTKSWKLVAKLVTAISNNTLPIEI